MLQGTNVNKNKPGLARRSLRYVQTWLQLHLFGRKWPPAGIEPVPSNLDLNLLRLTHVRDKNYVTLKIFLEKKHFVIGISTYVPNV